MIYLIVNYILYWIDTGFVLSVIPSIIILFPLSILFLFDIGNIIKDEKLYIIGGSMGQKTVAECEAYNLDNKTWTHVAKLNTRK